jgi:hypothetical protein
MITTKLYRDTPATMLDRVTGREIAKGWLRAGTEIDIEDTKDGTKIYGPGGYLYRLDSRLES